MAYLSNKNQSTIMKRIFSLLVALMAYGMTQSTNAQNVGIGTTAPSDKLTVQTATANYGVSHTDGTVSVGTYVGSGYGWLGTKTAHPLAFFTGGGNAQMTIQTNGNVGIGNVVPVNTFQIGTTPGFSGNDLAIGNGTQGMSFTQGTSASTWYSNVNFSLMPNGGNGFVGIGTAAPVNKLQIGSSVGFSGNDLAIGNGTQGMSFTQSTNASTWYSNVNFSLMPNGSAGNVGIGTQAPVNKLQIGSVGASGYGGNDIAFGNGTQVSGIAQTAATAQWYSTTNIALMPMGNGHGRVGINTTTPGFPLTVTDYVTSGTSEVAYFTDNNEGVYTFTGPVTASIYASNNVMATGFAAYSDARIKDILDISDGARDLQTLNQIQITDYTLKDKVNHGNRPFKKVIAQQVESVYPQVISKHVDFIPNVYRKASAVTRTDNGYLLSFDSAHHISKRATKLRILASNDHTMNSYDILAIPSDKEVLIDASQLNGDKVFVYGEQVDDFRTVDYEGLTTLNISATQELGKIVQHQQALIRAQNRKIATLEQKLATLMAAVNSHKQLN
jgi:hypothetical protein